MGELGIFGIHPSGGSGVWTLVAGSGAAGLTSSAVGTTITCAAVFAFGPESTKGNFFSHGV